jgi:ParB family chromosome partitioning protein
MAGKDRKNSLKAMFGEPLPPALETKAQLTAGNTPGDPTSPVTTTASLASPPHAVPRTASGAVKAMGLSLSSITREAEEARALRRAVEEGDRIVALDTAEIVDSFVSDRLSHEDRDDPDFLALVDSIGASGQQAPILVRPHPDQPGRYQVAYGHRRLKAVRRLGLKVKAIVRGLSDSELVLAQGKENAERRNLSFIERAVFAKTLVDHGFDRRIVGEALAVQKSELSRLLQVAEAVPEIIVRAVGPAPKAGRDRWMALAQLFVNVAAKAKALDESRLDVFAAASTDERFQRLFDRLSRRPVKDKPAPEDVSAPDGTLLARISRQGRAMRIDFSADADPAFVAEMGETLRQAYARFVAETAG